MMMPKMQRRLFLIGASALALSACGGNLLGPTDTGTMYDLRPSFPPAPPGEKVSWALSVLVPDMPGNLNGNRIALAKSDGTTDFYANATYPDRLPSLVQNALMDGFEASNRIDAVAREQDALHAEYNLVTEVKDFEARYSQPDGIPDVAVTIAAKLVTSHARKIVATFTAIQTSTASANSAGAVTAALQIALGKAVTDIVAWTLQAPPPPQMPGSPLKVEGQAAHDATRAAAKQPR
jgi:cholesterol transport system auxiliary component